MTPFETDLERALADQIRNAARHHNPPISQAELARVAGVGREAMSSYLNGHRAMPVRVLLAVAELLDIPLTELARRAQAQADE